MKKRLPLQLVAISPLAMVVFAACRPHQAESGVEQRFAAAHSIEREHLWHVVELPAGEAPPIRFHFPLPAESLAGEFPKLRGWMRVNSEAIGQNASGQFEVNIADLTMGDVDLDSNVRNNVEFLQSAVFPTSNYVITGITSDAQKLSKGHSESVTLDGEFKLKGVEIPLDVRATMERIREPSEEKIVLSGSFDIERLRERFQISGPGAEGDPNSDRVLVQFRIELAP